MTIRLFCTTILTLIVAAVFATSSSFAASAVSDGSIGIRPANEANFFHLSAAPGSTLKSTAIVSNQGATPVTLTIYPVDAVSTSAGNFAFEAQQADFTGIGLWAKTGAPTVTVPAHSELRVPFVLSIPARTVPGDYAGGVIIQSAPIVGSVSAADKQGAVSRIDIVERQGVRIYLHVAGKDTSTLARPALHWSTSSRGVNFSLKLVNTGTTILHPKATVMVSSRIGAPAVQLSFNTPEELLPGEDVTLHARLTDPPQIEIASLKAQLNSEAGSETPLGTLVLLNWWLIFGSLIAAVLLTFVGWKGIRYALRARAAIRRVATLDRVGTSASK